MKIFIVSTIYPSGHYTEYLVKGFKRNKLNTVSVIADKNNLNPKKIGNVTVSNIWNKDPRYVFQILGHILKEKPDLVHIQHEINMFGGVFTAIMFPLLLFFIKIKKIKLVTTIHATVEQRQINRSFLKTFHFNTKTTPVPLVKYFFWYLYTSVVILSDACIVHTNKAKKVLQEYVDKNKFFIIKHPVRNFKHTKGVAKKSGYFLYFGYIAKRKGLKDLIKSYKKIGHLKERFQLFLAGGVIKGQEKYLVEIKGFIRRLKLEKYVVFTGQVDEKTQILLYKNAYVALVPSKLSISSSGPICHALGHHKCIIASSTDYIKEEIIDKYTGLLVKNKNWHHLMKLVSENPKLVQKIEENTQIEVKKRTSFVVAGKHLSLYKKLITNK